MKCEKIRRKLSAYLDGELTEAERRVVASHLESCDLCSREYEEFQRLHAVLSNLDPVEAPPYLWRRVERGLILPQRTGFWEQVVGRLVYAPAAAAILIGLLVGNFLGQTVLTGSPQTESDLIIVSDLDDPPPGSFSDMYFDEWEE